MFIHMGIGNIFLNKWEKKKNCKWIPTIICIWIYYASNFVFEVINIY